jgi:hypothetical protein
MMTNTADGHSFAAAVDLHDGADGLELRLDAHRERAAA